MILEEETYKKFGYYPRDLTKGAHKWVLARCDDCGTIRKIRIKDYRALCHPCSLRGPRNPRWKRVKCVCETCGTIFYIWPSKIENGKGKYCSRPCAHIAFKKVSGKNHPNWKGRKKEQICQACGKVFTFYPSVQLGKFCSRSCARTAKKFPTHHTTPERIYEEICKNYNLPFEYTGDGTFWIHNINPDFVESNGKKIAVEVFGDYWHSPLLNWELKEDRTLPYRKKALKKYGWKLIVFWETDLLREDAEVFILNSLKKEKVM